MNTRKMSRFCSTCGLFLKFESEEAFQQHKREETELLELQDRENESAWKELTNARKK